MYRRALLATDFSAPATAGARLASYLAEPDAALLAVHVVPAVPTSTYAVPAVGLDPVPGFAFGQAVRAAGTMEEDETRLRGQLQSWVEEAGIRNLDTTLVHGDVARAVLQEAANHHADLVVLGARGHSRLDEVLLGSTARHVLRHAKSDVLLADEHVHVPPQRVALATSFDDASIAAAKRARAIADAAGAELLLLHSIGPGVQTGASYGLTPPGGPHLTQEAGWLERAVDEKMREFNAVHMGGRARIVVGKGHMAEEVARLAREAHADLVVTGHHEAGFLERLLLGSVSENLARRPPCSTLFVHHEGATQ